MTRSPLTPQDLQALTQARLTLGPRGRALDTGTALRFSLDHARAREAVLSELDVPRLQQALAEFPITQVTSRAGDRARFVKRPDLGRLLPEGTDLPAGPFDVALVLADGLSAVAVALNGAAFVRALARRLTGKGLTFSPVVLARQGRVALGDPIARAMQARTVVMALGERPGLSAADSLGVYVTHQPQAETPDSARNCISNIRDAGTAVEEAADQCLRLILTMRRTGQSGVALNQTLAAGGLLE